MALCVVFFLGFVHRSVKELPSLPHAEINTMVTVLPSSTKLYQNFSSDGFSVPVRLEPNSKSAPVGFINPNDTVNVLEVHGDWCRLQLNDQWFDAPDPDRTFWAHRNGVDSKGNFQVVLQVVLPDPDNDSDDALGDDDDDTYIGLREPVEPDPIRAVDHYYPPPGIESLARTKLQTDANEIDLESSPGRSTRPKQNAKQAKQKELQPQQVAQQARGVRDRLQPPLLNPSYNRPTSVNLTADIIRDSPERAAACMFSDEPGRWGGQWEKDHGRRMFYNSNDNFALAARGGPDETEPAIGLVRPGETVEVLALEGEWCLIKPDPSWCNLDGEPVDHAWARIVATDRDGEKHKMLSPLDKVELFGPNLVDPDWIPKAMKTKSTPHPKAFDRPGPLDMQIDSEPPKSNAIGDSQSIGVLPGWTSDNDGLSAFLKFGSSEPVLHYNSNPTLGLAVYPRPDLSTAPIGVIQPSQVVEVLGFEGDWARIDLDHSWANGEVDFAWVKSSTVEADGEKHEMLKPIYKDDSSEGSDSDGNGKPAQGRNASASARADAKDVLMSDSPMLWHRKSFVPAIDTDTRIGHQPSLPSGRPVLEWSTPSRPILEDNERGDLHGGSRRDQGNFVAVRGGSHRNQDEYVAVSGAGYRNQSPEQDTYGVVLGTSHRNQSLARGDYIMLRGSGRRNNHDDYGNYVHFHKQRSVPSEPGAITDLYSAAGEWSRPQLAEHISLYKDEYIRLRSPRSPAVVERYYIGDDEDHPSPLSPRSPPMMAELPTAECSPDDECNGLRENQSPRSPPVVWSPSLPGPVRRGPPGRPSSLVLNTVEDIPPKNEAGWPEDELLGFDNIIGSLPTYSNPEGPSIDTISFTTESEEWSGVGSLLAAQIRSPQHLTSDHDTRASGSGTRSAGTLVPETRSGDPGGNEDGWSALASVLASRSRSKQHRIPLPNPNHYGGDVPNIQPMRHYEATPNLLIRPKNQDLEGWTQDPASSSFRIERDNA